MSHSDRTPPRFMADAMLGKLARYLRFLGYDTTYQADIDDVELVRRAREEGRVLLTRDRVLARERRPERCIVLTSDSSLEQLREVAGRFGLARAAVRLPRCTLCNEPLETPPAEKVSLRAPPHVRDRHREFAWCRSCGRLYWEGSHVRRLRRRLRVAMASRPDPRDRRDDDG